MSNQENTTQPEISAIDDAILSGGKGNAPVDLKGKSVEEALDAHFADHQDDEEEESDEDEAVSTCSCVH